MSIGLREGLQRLLRHDFGAFIAQVFSATNPATPFLSNWHIDLIAEYLTAAERGEITRLIINVPPRALKSICVSVAWPAWILGHNPAARVLAASYAAPLSVKHSLDCRFAMMQPWYRALFPHTQLVRDQNEKHKFMTTARGYRIATSVGGTVTGEGGNFLILDDPLSGEQGESRAARDYAKRWFEHTFATRLDNKSRGVIVLVMQRLHADDLSGHLLKSGGWEHLCLPAVCVQPTVHDFGAQSIARAPGDILHAAREDSALIERAKRELGSRAFAAQYQQEPLAEEGGMVRASWLKRYDAPPEAPIRIVQSWDTAIKSGAAHDASVCLTFAEEKGMSYLLQANVLRQEYPELKRSVAALAERFSPDAILMEDKASGQQLLQDLRRETTLPLIALMPHGDKILRLASASAMLEAGRLALPKRAKWLAEFEAELFGFPAATHDDQVDALTQYLLWLRKAERNSARMRGI